MALERAKKPLSGSSKKSESASKGYKSGGREDEGSDKSPASSPADAERQRMAADLVLAQGRVQVAEAAVKQLQGEAFKQCALREQAERDSADVIAAQQRECGQLAEEARRLGKALAEAQELLARQEQELDAQRKAAVAAADEEASAEEDEATRLRRLLSRGQADAAAAASVAEAQQLQLKQRISHLMAEADRAADKIQTLGVRAAGWHAGLRFAHDLPWLAVTRRERLTGPAPAAPRPGAAALACTDGSIVLWGAAETEAGVPALSTIHLLDREGWRWEAPALQRNMPALQGQAAVGVGSKLVGMGGQGLAGPLHGMHFLPTATCQWVAAPVGADGGAGAAPVPRWGHALAYCPQRNCLYVFGGCSADGNALSDLWALHLVDMRWQDLGSQPTSRQGTNLAAGPVPRVNAAMTCSPDGSRLWLFGGAEPGGAGPGSAGAADDSGGSRRCLGDLAFFDLVGGGWTAVEAGAAGGTSIEPREGHAMASVGRFLLVVGGRGRGRDGRRRGLVDTWAFDTHCSAWDRLDDAAWQGAAGSGGSSTGNGDADAADAVPCVSLIDDGSAAIKRGCSNCSDCRPDRSCSDTQQPWLGAETCCFDATGRLHILQPALTTGMLCSLTTVELTLPDEVEARRAAHTAAHARVERLELVAEAEHVTATSLRVRWVEPSVLRDRRLGFKLFLTSLEGLQGRTREVYQGPALACDIAGLQPGQEIVLAVKATYDDGSHAWSDARAYRTLKC